MSEYDLVLTMSMNKIREVVNSVLAENPTIIGAVDDQAITEISIMALALMFSKPYSSGEALAYAIKAYSEKLGG